eukprot:Sspe_Gene.92843::Locus_65603_Transcript_1_1_Confidence_1.000_Length_944::g.92843::m.92843
MAAVPSWSVVRGARRKAPLWKAVEVTGQAVENSSIGAVLAIGRLLFFPRAVPLDPVDDDENVTLLTVMRALYSTLVSSACDAVGYWGLTNGLSALSRGRGTEVAIPLTAWGIQAFLRESRAVADDIAFDVRNRLFAHASRRSLEVLRGTAMDVVKNAATMMSMS